MIVRLLSWLRKRMRMVKTFFLLLLGALLVGDLFVPRHHPHFLGDVIPGFWAVFGLLACMLIIIVSKWLGHVWLFRPEDYYQHNEDRP